MNCPKCGTPMDFIGRHKQWYCPNCDQYNPPLNSKHPQRTKSPASKKKIIIIITLIIVIIIIIAVIGYLFYKSNQISVKVVNNSNEQLGVTILIDGYWSEEKNINPNEEFVFTDTGHMKGQENDIKLKFSDPVIGKLYLKEITTDNDVTFTIDEYYEITVTTG